jgi:hypothetical protein
MSLSLEPPSCRSCSLTPDRFVPVHGATFHLSTTMIARLGPLRSAPGVFVVVDVSVNGQG